jgi:hypothetical protein
MNPYVIAAASAVGLGYLIMSRSKTGDEATPVTINGRQWILEKTGQLRKNVTTEAGLVAVFETAYLVSAPALTYGPHGKMPVLAFSQVSDNPASRKLTARYPGVAVGIYNAAIKDFNLKDEL